MGPRSLPVWKMDEFTRASESLRKQTPIFLEMVQEETDAIEKDRVVHSTGTGQGLPEACKNAPVITPPRSRNIRQLEILLRAMDKTLMWLIDHAKREGGGWHCARKIEPPAGEYCYLCSEHPKDALFYDVMKSYDYIIRDRDFTDASEIGPKILIFSVPYVLEHIPTEPPTSAEKFREMCEQHVLVHDKSIFSMVYSFRRALHYTAKLLEVSNHIEDTTGVYTRLSRTFLEITILRPSVQI